MTENQTLDMLHTIDPEASPGHLIRSIQIAKQVGSSMPGSHVMLICPLTYDRDYFRIVIE